MSTPITLRGITWSHDRGYLPMVATAEAYTRLHPSIVIEWEKRTLKEFEETPVDRLAPHYDLLVIDHPFVGAGARLGVFQPLDDVLPKAFLADQAANSVGGSHASYSWDRRQWALAIDAAAPVAFWSDEGLDAAGLAPAKTWDDLIELGDRGCLEIPAAPIYCLMNFFMMCGAAGEEPFQDANAVVSRPVGREALAVLRELINRCEPGVWKRNPIASHELVASGKTTAAYCPFSYGYYNYAREGRSPRRLRFGEMPTWQGKLLHSTLGGTGLAISAKRPQIAAALDYAQYVASAEIQRTLYTRAGGQPGHRKAWTDPENNRLTQNCYADTLPAVDRAYVRPRYAGYLEFQERAGAIVHGALRGRTADDDALHELDSFYRHSPLSVVPVA